MNKGLFIGIVGAIVAAAMLALGYSAGMGRLSAPSMASGAVDRVAVERIMRDYLVNNPEILVEVQAALEIRETEAKKFAQVDTIQSAKDLIFNASYDGIFGNPDGKVTVVEFFDYNCGYCKRALGDMDKLAADHKDVRFVMKEFPILGPDSQKASVVSMALRTLAPEKYGEFHRQLLGSQGRATEAGALRIATALGVDEARLREEMKNPAILAAFRETYELATKLAITGTPSYVIGQEVVFGALGHEVLTEKIETARKNL